MNLVSRTVAAVFLICGAAAAQDFTGRWAGAADSTDEAGTKRNEKQSFDIKLDGKLVGSFSAQHNSPKKWIYDRIGAMTFTKEPAPATPTAAK